MNSGFIWSMCVICIAVYIANELYVRVEKEPKLEFQHFLVDSFDLIWESRYLGLIYSLSLQHTRVDNWMKVF